MGSYFSSPPDNAERRQLVDTYKYVMSSACGVNYAAALSSLRSHNVYIFPLIVLAQNGRYERYYFFDRKDRDKVVYEAGMMLQTRDKHCYRFIQQAAGQIREVDYPPTSKQAQDMLRHDHVGETVESICQIEE